METTKLSLKAQLIATTINDGGSNTFASIIGLVAQKMLTGGRADKATGIYPNNLVGRVTRLGKYSVALNGNYTNAMRKATNDPTFVPQKAWFTRVLDGVNGSIVTNNSDPSCEYLAYMLSGYQFIGYFVDGRPATFGEIEQIEQYKVATTHNLVGFATIGLEGIKVLNAGGLTMEWT